MDMTREMLTYSRSTDSLPDFVVENQLNTFVYLKFLICPSRCHDGTKLDIILHSALHQYKVRVPFELPHVL